MPAPQPEVLPPAPAVPEVPDDNSDAEEADFASLAAQIEEDDDGHEDMDESVMQATMEAGADFLDTELCEMTVTELLDLVLGEMAGRTDAAPDHPNTLREALKRPDSQHWWEWHLRRSEHLRRMAPSLCESANLETSPLEHAGFSESSTRQMAALKTGWAFG